jgi:hypothetical protein
MNDWPDRYIHTNFDSPANIDATKLQRAAFIGSASALFLANMKPADVPALWDVMKAASTHRGGTVLERRTALSPAEGGVLTRAFLASERGALASIASFAAIPADVSRDADLFLQRLETLLGPSLPLVPATGEGAIVFQRVPAVSGPMSLMANDYFADHHTGPTPRLLGFPGLRGSGSEYAYEVLNSVDGQRNAQVIRDLVSAEYGPVPLDVVVEYLRALEKAGAIRQR